jgi:hypothetical protein
VRDRSLPFGAILRLNARTFSKHGGSIRRTFFRVAQTKAQLRDLVLVAPMLALQFPDHAHTVRLVHART